MLNDLPIQVGDELVEYGKVYKVFAIEDKKMYDGKVEKHVFFKPVFETTENRTLSCAIPLKNITQANIRRPIAKKAMVEVLQVLSSDSFEAVELMDITIAKDILKLNDPHQNAKVLRTIWMEVNDEELNTTKSRKDMLDLSVKSLAEELAYTFEISLEKAEKKLENALKKSLS